MNISDVLFVFALVLGVVEVIRSKGESLLAWAIVLVCVGLLRHLVG